MSDYLTHLAARTLKLVELAQPRLQSMFEPQRDFDRLATEPSLGFEPSDAEHFSISRAVTNKKHPGASTHSPSVMPSATAPIGVTQTQQNSVDARAGGEHVSTLSQRPTVAQPIASGVVPFQSVVAQTPVLPSTLGAFIRDAPKRSHPAGPSAHEAVTTLRSGEASKENQPARPAMHSRNAKAVVPIRVAAYREPRSASAEAAPGHENTPVIRVTINRVEVRAIMPAQTPAPRSVPREQAPSLSLESYLKQRERGRR